MIDDVWLKHQAAAEYLGVGQRWLYEEGDKGRIKRIRIAGGYRYRRSALDDYFLFLEREQSAATVTPTVVPLRQPNRTA